MRGQQTPPLAPSLPTTKCLCWGKRLEQHPAKRRTGPQGITACRRLWLLQRAGSGTGQPALVSLKVSSAADICPALVFSSRSCSPSPSSLAVTGHCCVFPEASVWALKLLLSPADGNVALLVCLRLPASSALSCGSSSVTVADLPTVIPHRGRGVSQALGNPCHRQLVWERGHGPAEAPVLLSPLLTLGCWV